MNEYILQIICSLTQKNKKIKSTVEEANMNFIDNANVTSKNHRIQKVVLVPMKSKN